MMYADYTYYNANYGGNTIKESDYAHFGVRASAYIDNIVFGRIKTTDDVTDSVRMATCACADVLYVWDGVGGDTVGMPAVKSETTDGYRVDYDSASGAASSLIKKVYEAIEIYLPAYHPLRYRGKGQQ